MGSQEQHSEDYLDTYREIDNYFFFDFYAGFLFLPARNDAKSYNGRIN
jgi:hypothetical protein